MKKVTNIAARRSSLKSLISMLRVSLILYGKRVHTTVRFMEINQGYAEILLVTEKMGQVKEF